MGPEQRGGTTPPWHEWQYVNVGRLFPYIEESIDHGTQWAVFEPNDQRGQRDRLSWQHPEKIGKRVVEIPRPGIPGAREGTPAGGSSTGGAASVLAGC
jgi:hypothetical protein